MPVRFLLYKVLPGLWLSPTLELRGAVGAPQCCDLPGCLCSAALLLQLCSEPVGALRGLHLLLLEPSQNPGASSSSEGEVCWLGLLQSTQVMFSQAVQSLASRCCGSEALRDPALLTFPALY